jgi:hypothetical protein
MWGRDSVVKSLGRLLTTKKHSGKLRGFVRFVLVYQVFGLLWLPFMERKCQDRRLVRTR